MAVPSDPRAPARRLTAVLTSLALVAVWALAAVFVLPLIRGADELLGAMGTEAERQAFVAVIAAAEATTIVTNAALILAATGLLVWTSWLASDPPASTAGRVLVITGSALLTAGALVQIGGHRGILDLGRGSSWPEHAFDALYTVDSISRLLIVGGFVTAGFGALLVGWSARSASPAWGWLGVVAGATALSAGALDALRIYPPVLWLCAVVSVVLLPIWLLTAPSRVFR